MKCDLIFVGGSILMKNKIHAVLTVGPPSSFINLLKKYKYFAITEKNG